MLFCKSRWLIGVLHRAPVFWRTLNIFWTICKFVAVGYLLLPCCFTGLDYQQRPIESARILGGLQLALDQENQKVAGRSCWWEWSTSDKNTAVVVVTFLEATTIFFEGHILTKGIEIDWLVHAALPFCGWQLLKPFRLLVSGAEMCSCIRLLIYTKRACIRIFVEFVENNYEFPRAMACESFQCDCSKSHFFLLG